MTFSICARCPDTGMFGIAISSSSPAVAARCAHARARAGVIASQNITDPNLGLAGLVLLEGDASAERVMADLIASTPYAEYRQLAIVDRQGRTAGFSGDGALGIHGIAEGSGCIAAGNLLANPAVPQAMVDAYTAASGAFPARLLMALNAGLVAGGEAGPVFSAGLKVVRDVRWPIVDLRVDWAESPIAELAKIWTVYAPQMEAYVSRATDPSVAPSFGVPGDE
jgi:uncharacterized Ntn-hydrolase superfamily protein